MQQNAGIILANVDYASFALRLKTSDAIISFVSCRFTNATRRFQFAHTCPDY